MKSLCVYFLDDDIDDLELFQHAAFALGHRVSLFKNSISLLLALDAHSHPDAIFLDIHMPMMGGDDMLRKLKTTERWKDLPVVMISGACPKKLLCDYRNSGACGVMKKPHGAPWADSLAKTIDECFGENQFHVVNRNSA